LRRRSGPALERHLPGNAGVDDHGGDDEPAALRIAAKLRLLSVKGNAFDGLPFGGNAAIEDRAIVLCDLPCHTVYHNTLR
jgi:hypothetical protein